MKYVLAIFLTVSLMGCDTPGLYDIYKNANIDSKEKSEIRRLVELINQSIKNRDIEAVRSIKSKYFPDNQFAALPNLLNNINIDRKSGGYTVLSEFLLKGGPSVPIISHVSDSDKLGNRYSYLFSSYGAETYICLVTVNDDFSAAQCLISCIFNKESGVWKLSGLKAGPYSYRGLPAPQLLLAAQDLYNKNDRFASYMYLQIARNLSRPDDPCFKYEIEMDLVTLSKRIDSGSQGYNISKLKAVMPGIKFLSLMPEYQNGRYYPVLVYKTVTPLREIGLLTSENEEVNTKINEVMIGLNAFSDTIIYRVTNVELDNGHVRDHVDFTRLIPEK